MALTRCEAVVVRTYPLGDTSRIAVMYSREFGLVPRENLVGKVDLCLWPPARVGVLE